MELTPAQKEERKAKWDCRYIRLARHISTWSKDPNAQVGAVITDARVGRIISMGFNGFPQGIEDDPDKLGNKDEKLLRILHAEQNALLRAGLDAEGANVYVFGKPVCNSCAAMLVQARVSRVIARRPDPFSETTWEKAGRVGLEMIEESKISFTEINPSWLEA